MRKQFDTVCGDIKEETGVHGSRLSSVSALPRSFRPYSTPQLVALIDVQPTSMLEPAQCCALIGLPTFDIWLARSHHPLHRVSCSKPLNRKETWKHANMSA
jgi:hypothetical protein